MCGCGGVDVCGCVCVCCFGFVFVLFVFVFVLCCFCFCFVLFCFLNSCNSTALWSDKVILEESANDLQNVVDMVYENSSNLGIAT